MKQRNLGIECLRIVAMFMIVMLHVLGQGGVLYEAKQFSSQYMIAWFLEVMVVAAVNIYAIISGYVGYEAKWKISRIINLWMQVFFYSVILAIIFMALYPEDFLTKVYLMKAVMPITTAEYWYISSYFGMFFLMPVLNIAIDKLEERQLRISLLGLLMMYTILPTAFNQDPFSLNEGYSVLWLCILYLVGGYLKKYQIADRISHKAAGLTWVFCVIGTWGLKMLLEFATLHVFGEVKYSYVLVYYTMPVTVVEAIALVLFFSKVTLKKPWLQEVVPVISGATLGVYIIHVQTFVFYKIIYQMTTYLAYENPVTLLVVVFVDAIAVYGICTLIDICRKKIFGVLKVARIAEWVDHLVASKQERTK